MGTMGITPDSCGFETKLTTIQVVCASPEWDINGLCKWADFASVTPPEITGTT